MKIHKIVYISLLILFVLSSCIKDIDTEPIPRDIEEVFIVEQSIKNDQSFYRFYENTVQFVSSNKPAIWDLAFESAGDSGRVLSNYAREAELIKTGKYNIDDVSQNDVLNLFSSTDWMFDDPAYTNYTDSLSLKDWEDGEVYVLNRVTNDENNYYKIQFVERNDNEFIINFAKAIDDSYETISIARSDGLAYVYFSFNSNSTVQVEPQMLIWHLMFTPYFGWYETNTPGEFYPYNQSGILINYENGVRVAQIFDENIEFVDIDSTYIPSSEFTDWKGAIGSNWKLLGGTDSDNIYQMDPNKKYIIKVYDADEQLFKYYKLRIIDYKLDGIDHFPTIEFKHLEPE